MAESLRTQIEELQSSMQAIEGQRSVLGDVAVNLALAALRKQLTALEEQAASEATPAEERRLVTILFVDMVGSTGMAEKVDPEEWHQVLKRLHAILGEKVAAHHGEVGKFLGDGMLAYFGMREASEDDPENAIRAALDAQAAVAGSLSAEQIQIRAGIHTGLVVMGELGEASHMEFTASGDAMNLAARLQSAAPPGGVLISQDTYRYVRGVFDLTPRPPLTVKGKGEPIHTYLVRQAKPRPFRSVTRGVAGVQARTVGREVEMQALQAAYLRAYAGHGTAWVQLVSAPGIGKSRLLGDLNDWIDLRDETIWLLRARSFPDEANQPFSLVRRLWFDRFQIAEDASLAQAEAKWMERFKEYRGKRDFEEEAHALGLLMGLPFEDSPYTKAMRNDPVQVKGRAMVVSRALVHSMRAQNPMVVLLEDLQWTDAASWEYLMDVFLDGAGDGQFNGLLIAAAARPEWSPPQKLTELFKSSSSGEADARHWGSHMALAPLSDDAMRELAKDLFQRAGAVPEQMIDLLVERSEGVPYYEEEMVNWLIDNGVFDVHEEPWRFLPEKLKAQPLPATLQHLLLTRLSSLSQPERAALQRGAIFGRRFWAGGLEALGVPGSEETLGHLQPRGFVEAQPESAFQTETEWSFQQGLLQEVTYESVLKRERAALHKVAAGWLEKQARQAGRLEEFAGLLGAHCERAGDLSAAADWYMRAGKRAMGQGAPAEAKRFYSLALDLLPPVDKERRWWTLLGHEEAVSVLGEAEFWRADVAALVELARSFERDDRLAEAYSHQTSFLMRTGDMLNVEDACQNALAAAQRSGNEAMEATALALLAVVTVDRVDPGSTVQRLEEALRLAHHLHDETILAGTLFRAAYCYYGLGYLSQALDMQRQQIELDHRLGNRSMQALGLLNLASGQLGVGLYKQARGALEQAREIAEALGSRRLYGGALQSFGELYLALGDLRKARQEAELGMEPITESGDAISTAHNHNCLGAILLGMGDATGAARHYAEAQQIASAKGIVTTAGESVAGLAACAIMQGRLDEARQYAQRALDHLKEYGWKGQSSAGRVFRPCAEAFEALGDTECAAEVLEMAYAALTDVADSISDPSWRQAFLENVPDHRALMQMWERLHK